MHTIDRLADRRRRLAAAAAIAVVSVVVAAVMHAATGGGIPSLVAVSLALVVSVVIGTFVVGPRLTRRRAAAGVALDQAVFHTLFAFFGPASVGAATAVGDHADHGMPTLGITAAPVAAAPVAAMVLGHLVAAIVAYAMLRRGTVALESIASALTTALARLLDPRIPPPVTLPSLLRLAATGTSGFTAAAAFLRLPDGRGPPPLAAA